MPSQGSTFGIFPDMEEDEHRIIEVGIPLFQLVFPKPIYYEQKVDGVFDVRVDAADPDVRRSKPVPQWHWAGEAKLSFKPRNKRGLGVGWMPDDPWFKNRVHLMEHAWLAKMVKQERLPNGRIKSAAEVSFELKLMEAVLKQQIPIWEVFRNGRAEAWFDSEQKAKDAVDDEYRTEVKLDKQGTLKPRRVSKDDLEIRDGFRYVWKPKVLAMIKRENRINQFGWTQSKEFMLEWKPKILDEIKSKRESFNAEAEQVEGHGIAQELKGMTEAERKVLAEALRPYLTSGKDSEQQGPSKSGKKTAGKEIVV